MGTFSTMIEELASDYCNFMRVDVESEFHNVQDVIDDMLTRLDEFENLVNMVRTDGHLCVDVSIPEIMKFKEGLDSLGDRIDRLDQFVNRVKSDVDMIESQVEEAELQVGQNNKTLKNIFKPLFFSSGEVQPRRTGRTPTYEAPTLFSTSNYFSHNEQDSDCI